MSVFNIYDEAFICRSCGDREEVDMSLNLSEFMLLAQSFEQRHDGCANKVHESPQKSHGNNCRIKGLH